MTYPLEVGVLGLGRGATLASSFAADPRIGQVTVADPDETRATPIGCHRVRHLVEILDRRPDLVVVATPVPLHSRHCLSVLAAGTSVLSETPPCTTIDEARALSSAAAAAKASSPNLQVMLAEDYLWLDWMKTAQEAVVAEFLGELITGHGLYREDARSAFVTPEGWPSWRADLPPLHYLTHTLGPLLTLMSDHVVTAWGFSPKHSGNPLRQQADIAHAIFETEGGRLIELSVGFGTAYPYGFELEIVGSTGSLRLEHWTRGRALQARDGSSGGWQVTADGSLDDEGAARRTEGMVSHVIDVLDGLAGPRCGLADLLRFTLPGIAADLSASSGSIPVRVPDHRQWL